MWRFLNALIPLYGREWDTMGEAQRFDQGKPGKPGQWESVIRNGRTFELQEAHTLSRNRFHVLTDFYYTVRTNERVIR